MFSRFQFLRNCIRKLIFASLPVLFASQLCAQTSVSPSSPPAAKNNAEFLAAADEVLQQMSEITGWKLKSPLKKSIRSREEIHSYVLRQMDDEKDAKERYASTRSAEAFGLIPKGFNLEGFLVDLLTEQVAGLYDPKAHEFYIADWIEPDEQRMVMSHELTHALEDQQFQIEDWVKAARPNDDAEMARESVLEGSAMAAMLDYMLQEKGLKLLDLPDIDPSVFVGDLSATPLLKKAPPFIKDSLMFPYFSGLTFSMMVLKSDGWRGFSSVFARPPASTQQIMHPELYRSNTVPKPLKLGLPGNFVDANWTLLEQNSMGEFGWKEVLKQFLGEDRAKQLSASWDGDLYATFEQKDTKKTLLVTHIRLANEETAARFLGQYSEALEKKHAERSNLLRQPNFFSFNTPDGPVFLRCSVNECVTLEGGDRTLFPKWMKSLGWSSSPVEREKPSTTNITTTTSINASVAEQPGF
ncbi:MAG TPA: hypothetical protein VGH37_09425 [Candidatus Acidoferrum sp.]|jgi:hypothetical protein